MSATIRTTQSQIRAAGRDVARAETRRPFNFGRWFAATGWRHLIGIVFAVFCAFPLVYVVSSSLNPGGTLTGSNVLFAHVDFSNYVNLLFNLPQQPYIAWFLNTMFIGLATAAGTVFLGALAAYAFSRMRFVGRRTGLLALLLVQMFPQLLAVVAIFLLLNAISGIFPLLGLNSQLGLVLVYMGGALGVNTYLMYGFFNTVPASLDEAAKIDGAGHARTFFTIVLPLVGPILAVVGLLSFIGSTSEYVVASIVLTDPTHQTLAVGLYSFISQATSANWTIFSAGAVMAAIPPMALFLYLQKYVISGLTAGAVK
jgi:arabinogalactan oligomer/maltooligosaccharide transport system permease protein